MSNSFDRNIDCQPREANANAGVHLHSELYANYEDVRRDEAKLRCAATLQELPALEITDATPSPPVALWEAPGLIGQPRADDKPADDPASHPVESPVNSSQPGSTVPDSESESEHAGRRSQYPPDS